MKIIAAYLLAVLGGNAAPSAANINTILESVGASAEEADINTFLGEVSGKDIWEVIASGSEKLASAPTGGVAVAAAGGAVAAAGAAEEAPKEEAKKEESEADVGAGGLFGDAEEGADY